MIFKNIYELIGTNEILVIRFDNKLLISDARTVDALNYHKDTNQAPIRYAKREIDLLRNLEELSDKEVIEIRTELIDLLDEEIRCLSIILN